MTSNLIPPQGQPNAKSKGGRPRGKKDSTKRDKSITAKDRRPQLSKALQNDYLCPHVRFWARYEIALQTWMAENSEFNSLSELENKSGIKVATLSAGRKPNGNKPLAKKRLKLLAPILKVDADWLINGYAEDGRDVWPKWVNCHVREGRVAVGSIFIDCLDLYIRRRAVPPIIKSVILGQGLEDDNEWEKETTPDSICRSYSIGSEVRNYLIRNKIDLDSYLRRYRQYLTVYWQAFRVFAKGKNYMATYEGGEMVDPFDVNDQRQKIREQFVPPDGGLD